MDTKLKKYIPFTVRINVTNLSEKEIIKLLIPADDLINDLFGYESFGEKSELMDKISDPNLKMFTK